MQKLRLGMLGGGKGSMIGDIHRYAARIDNRYELIGGAFSNDLQKSLALASELGLSPQRIYADAEKLFAAEMNLPAEERLQVIAILTPNDCHYAMAKQALTLGFHILLEKPITLTLAEAQDLQKVAAGSRGKVCINYTYTGYPMLKEARARIAANEIGQIRKIFVSFSQGWLSEPIENQHQKQASWRTDPKRSGISGTMADIGVHAFNLSEYLSSQFVTELCADLQSVVKQRPLDDDGAVFLRYDQGASGVLTATQVAAGEDANLKICLYGDKGGMEWEHRHPNRLLIKYLQGYEQVLHAGKDNKQLTELTRQNCRTPKGHPEGYLEAIANHYHNFALDISGESSSEVNYPTLDEGVRGMAFIEAVVRCRSVEAKWIPFSSTEV